MLQALNFKKRTKNLKALCCQLSIVYRLLKELRVREIKARGVISGTLRALNFKERIRNLKVSNCQLSTVYCLLISSLLLPACSSDLSDDPIPYQPFPEISINLNLPEYFSLQSNGGYKEISGGVRGIIVYRSNNSFYAFERNCSFQPNDACATVEVHTSGLFMEDTCCGSSFSFNGDPTGGPAWRPLLKYQTYLNGNVVTITDEVVE
jgi:hypothetical protein